MKFELFGLRVEIRRRSLRSKIEHTPRPRIEGEASEEFWRAFQFGGTLVATCGCGRTHFCTNTTLDYEPGELEGLVELAAMEAGRYFPNATDDSVAVIDAPGGLIVWGCPCRRAAALEEALTRRRREITRFYQLATEKAARDLDAARADLSRVKGWEDA